MLATAASFVATSTIDKGHDDPGRQKRFDVGVLKRRKRARAAQPSLRAHQLASHLFKDFSGDLRFGVRHRRDRSNPWRCLPDCFCPSRRCEFLASSIANGHFPRARGDDDLPPGSVEPCQRARRPP
jgi:hypothetical protein